MKEITLEEVFQFLWPNECWEHKWMRSNCEAFGEAMFCVICKKWLPELTFFKDPDLLTPEWQNKMLERLVEMGYEWSLDYAHKQHGFQIINKHTDVFVWLPNSNPPEAVLGAIKELMKYIKGKGGE